MKNIMKGLVLILCAVMAIESAGCGYFMYPDRRGQKGGQIDAGIAVLDGVGLILFIVPGIVAYAVDFTNGTIYLPNTYKREPYPRTFKFDPAHYSYKTFEEIIKAQTGLTVDLAQADIQAVRLGSVAELKLRLARE